MAIAADRDDDEATEYGVLIARIAELEARVAALEEIAEVLPPRARQRAFEGM
jgi:hypothetical protein